MCRIPNLDDILLFCYSFCFCDFARLLVLERGGALEITILHSKN